ncbi:hypothetical protein [Photobacterium damselae]|uniref:hypothetical protein n=1 Tax=Photobacterium damselae TaxID=38293 RepID=UPI004067919D
MRVTTNSMFSDIAFRMGDHFTAMNSQMQHSQYRVLKAGDDPIAEGRIINLQKSLDDITDYQNSNDVLSAKLGEAQSNVENYGASLDTLQQTFVRVTSGTMNGSDLKHLSHQLDAIESSLLQNINQKSSRGESMFSGTLVDKVAFHAIQKTIKIEGKDVVVDTYGYQGNEEQQQTKIGTNQSLPTTFSGGELVSNQHGGNIFDTIGKMRYYLSQGKEIPNSLKNNISDELDGLLDSKIKIASDIGIGVQESKRTSNVYLGMKERFTELMSNTRDADYIGVVSEIKIQQQIMKTIASTSKVLLEMAKLRIE